LFDVCENQHPTIRKHHADYAAHHRLKRDERKGNRTEMEPEVKWSSLSLSHWVKIHANGKRTLLCTFTSSKINTPSCCGSFILFFNFCCFMASYV